jgi:N-acetylglutamate synthase-like GNAT family acetyltransferase
LRISAPGLLNSGHLLGDFQCTAPELTHWLVHRAFKNQIEGASRCFVVCDSAQRVVAYYALAAGSVAREQAPGKVRRNMPEPIPVAVLARLAVHNDWTGRGLGRGLLRDAIQRTVRAARELGIRALLCHAIDERAKAFYVHHGFVTSPIDANTVMLGLSHIEAATLAD